MPAEPACRLLKVFPVHQRQFGEPPDGPFEAESGPKPVEQQRSQIGAQGAGGKDKEEVQRALLGEVAGQREDQLAGDGRNNGLRKGETANAPFTQSIDGPRRETHDAGEPLCGAGCTGHDCPHTHVPFPLPAVSA